jgi:hypothetical protein
MKGFIHFLASGSDFRNSSLSDSVKIRCPPSFGILPKLIGGIFEIGILRRRITKSFPSAK